MRARETAMGTKLRGKRKERRTRVEEDKERRGKGNLDNGKKKIGQRERKKEENKR